MSLKTLLLLLVPRPSLPVRLNCQEAEQLSCQTWPAALRGLQPASLLVSDCPSLHLSLPSLPWSLHSLQLSNISQLSLNLGPQLPTTLRELIVTDSTLTREFSFTSKAGSRLAVHSCTFTKGFAVTSWGREGVALPPDLVTVSLSEFQEEVEVLGCGEGQGAQWDSYIALTDNWFRARTRLVARQLGVTLAGNTFSLAPGAGVLALFSCPAQLNITGNSFVRSVRARHAHHGYMAAEKLLSEDDLSDYFLVEPSNWPATLWANTLKLEYED